MALRFRQFTFLYENRIEFLKKTTPQIDTSHDDLAKHKTPHDIIDHFASKADPSENKQYTQWIVNKYKRKDFRQEDHSRIKRALEGFDEHKSKLENKDINSYKRLSDLEDAVDKHREQPVQLSGKQQRRKIKEDGAETIHDSPNLRVVHLKTPEAAKFYAAGTKWCTSNANMFKSYSQSGPIYYLEDKKNNNAKYQFHAQSSQFMDAKDRQADLKSFVAEHPEMKTIHALKANSEKNVNVFKMTQHLHEPEERKTILHNLISNTLKEPESGSTNAYTLAHDFPESHDSLVQSNNKFHRYAVAAYTRKYDDILHKDSDQTVREAVARGTKDTKILDKLYKDTSESVREAVAGVHPNYALKLANDPSDKVKSTVMHHHPDFAKTYLEDPKSSSDLKHQAFNRLFGYNKNIPDDLAKKYLDHANQVSRYKYLSPEMRKQVLSDMKSASNDKYPLLTQHSKMLPKELINDVYKTKSSDLINKIANIGSSYDLTKTSNKNILNQLSNHPRDSVALSALDKLISTDSSNRQAHIENYMSNKKPSENDRYQHDKILHTIARLTNNPEHFKDNRFKLFGKPESGYSHGKDVMLNPNAPVSLKKKIAKTFIDSDLTTNKWGINMKEVVDHLDDGKDLAKLWKHRSGTSKSIMNNQDYINAIINHPNVDNETKASATKSLVRAGKNLIKKEERLKRRAEERAQRRALMNGGN